LVLLAALAIAEPARAGREPVSLVITPNTFIGGTVDAGFGTGTVTIGETLPDGTSWPVSLAATGPITVANGLNVCYVPPNSNSCTFDVRADSVNSTTESTISATSVNVTIYTTVTVSPNQVSSLSISPGEL
jgi:hypothetical protein